MRKTIVASLFLAPSLAFASAWTVPNTNPRDLGLCASSVAAQRDAGAVFALPAALARIEGLSVKAGGGVVNVFNDWTDPTPGATVPRLGDPPEPGTSSLDLQFTGFPNVAVSYGGKVPFLGNRGVGAGLSIQPFGGAIVRWPADWAGRYRIVEVNRRAFSAIASAGIEVIPQVRIGGGVMYYYTTEKFTQKAWMQPYPLPAGNAANPDATVKLDMDGDAFTYTASAEIEPLRGIPLTFAVDYKHKATQHLDGDVTWTGTEPYFAGAQIPQLTAIFGARSASQTLTIPNLLNVGVAYRVIKPLLVTATFTFDRWIVYDRDLFTANTGFQLDVRRDYGNGQTYRAGAEYDVSPALQVRVGVQRDVSALSSAVYSPTLPDASSWGVSGGLTFRFARGVYLDAGLFYANMDKVDAPTNAGSEPRPPATLFSTGTFRGSYEPQALIYSASLGWTPGARTGP